MYENIVQKVMNKFNSYGVYKNLLTQNICTFSIFEKIRYLHLFNSTLQIMCVSPLMPQILLLERNKGQISFKMLEMPNKEGGHGSL